MRLLWIALVVVFVDQAAKITVLETMYRSQSISLIGDWLRLTFTENPGMAFGITFGPPGMVTAFSILATFLIVLYLYRVRKGYTPYRVSLAFILGGAIGNIIDRVFYAKIFSNGPLFQGHVVDFIHVNLWRGYVPEAVPVIGGNYVALFPIWNVADMAIVCGVIGILVFQKKFHMLLAEREGGGADVSEDVPSVASPALLNGDAALPSAAPLDADTSFSASSDDAEADEPAS